MLTDLHGTMRGVAGNREQRVGLRLAERPGEPVVLSVHRGQTFISVGDDAGWNGTWSGAVRTDRDSMIAEMAIPWSTLEAVGLSRESLKVKCDGTGLLALSMRDARLEDYPSLEMTVPHRLAKSYTVKLHFAELDDIGPGQRVFDVRLQGHTVFESLDIVEEADGRFTALVKEFTGVEAANTLTVELVPRSQEQTPTTTPILSGLEVIAEQ